MKRKPPTPLIVPPEFKIRPLDGNPLQDDRLAEPDPADLDLSVVTETEFRQFDVINQVLEVQRTHPVQRSKRK